MKITLTGSLGRIGRPLALELISMGHSVAVISSNPEKQHDIEKIGATAAIGTLTDRAFVTSFFSGADAVYCMVPPANYFDARLDLTAYYRDLGSCYAQAVRETGVTKVVNLSTIGAHLDKGNGILVGAYFVENLLNDLPENISVSHIRPTEIYYNLLPQAYSAKHNGYIAMNIGNEVVNSWVSPKDIAAAAAEEIVSTIPGRKIRYVASEDLSYNELVSILGAAIGRPDLKWLNISDGQMQDALISIGMQRSIAAGMTEMYAAINSGLLYEDYNLNKPHFMGKVKVADFAKDFAAACENI